MITARMTSAPRINPSARAARHKRAVVQVHAFKVELQLPSGTKTIDVPAGQFILDGVDVAGVDLPFMCRTGTCGTCAAKVVSGKVDLKTPNVLSPDHVSKGYVLLCSSQPLSDLVLSTHKEEELNLSAY